MFHKPTAQNANVDKHVLFKEDSHKDLSDDAGFQSAVEDEAELEEEESEHEDITSTSDIEHEEEPEETNISDDDSHLPHPSCKTLDMFTCMLNTMDQYQSFTA
eukprot:7988493-Ditylum_brightwellii.AAC.1